MELYRTTLEELESRQDMTSLCSLNQGRFELTEHAVAWNPNSQSTIYNCKNPIDTMGSLEWLICLWCFILEIATKQWYLCQKLSLYEGCYGEEV